MRGEGEDGPLQLRLQGFRSPPPRLRGRGCEARGLAQTGLRTATKKGGVCGSLEQADWFGSDRSQRRELRPCTQ